MRVYGKLTWPLEAEVKEQLKRQIRVLALDLDGTFMRRDRSVSEANREAVRRCLKLGWHVFIITGRPHSFAKQVQAQVSDQLGIVSFVGAHIDIADAKWQEGYPLEPAKMIPLLEELAAYPELELYIKSYDTVYTYNDRSEAGTYEPEIMRTYVLRDFSELVGVDILKIVVYESASDHLRTLCESSPHLQNFTLTNGGFPGLEIIRADRNKGVALQNILDFYGLPKSAAIAFGDAHNDLALLKQAGLGVAMGNACPELQAEADLVCPTVDADGVAQVINSILE